MIDEGDNGERLATPVATRVVARFPRTRAEFVPHSSGLQATIVVFTPSNGDGIVVGLITAYEWSFDIDAGRFKMFDQEPMVGSEEEHVDRITNAIVQLAVDGFRLNWLDRLFSFGRDRFAAWEV